MRWNLWGLLGLRIGCRIRLLILLKGLGWLGLRYGCLRGIRFKLRNVLPLVQGLRACIRRSVRSRGMISWYGF